MYHSTLASKGTRHASTAALFFVTLAAGACRDDVTSPNPATSPVALGGPHAAVIQRSATLTARILTIQGQIAPERLAILVFPGGEVADTVTIADNSALDRDLSTGRFTVTVPIRSSYKVCAVGSSKTFVTAGFVDACQTISGGSNSVDVAVVAHRRPIVQLFPRNTSGGSITGATIRWTTSLGTQQTDTDAATPGRIFSIIPGASTAVYCETVAPFGYRFIDPQCVAMEVTWDTVYFVTLVHQKLPKLPLP